MTIKIPTVSDLPQIPAVYALYGGQRKGLYVAYVGVAGKLTNRVSQHLVRRDSSVATGMTAGILNSDFITELKARFHQHRMNGDNNLFLGFIL